MMAGTIYSLPQHLHIMAVAGANFFIYSNLNPDLPCFAEKATGHDKQVSQCKNDIT
jgi:hypothetical protein